MNSNPIFQTLRELVSQGDTGQALQTFIAYLENTGTHPEALRALRVVEANFNTARQKENKGILNFSEARAEYAKANDALLSMLEDMAAGRTTATQTPASAQPRLLPWLIGGGIVLVVGVLAGIFFSRRPVAEPEKPGKTATEQAQNDTASSKDVGGACPQFNADRFKIMILQFQNLGEGRRTPELSVQTRIRELTGNNKLPTDVEIFSDKKLENNTPDVEDATKIGKQCQADMVIWGQYEPLPENAIEVDIRYAFTDAAWPPGVARQTFKNVSEIKADRMKITQLDEAVFRICTALALHENRMDLAKKWLNKLQQPTPREKQWKEMLNKSN